MRSPDGACGRRSCRTHPRVHRPLWLFALSAVLMLAAGSLASAAGPPYADSPISTIAGTPLVYGYGGDGGPATAPGAKLNLPFDVVVADDGSYYIADESNNVIRKVDPGGTITTFAGTGTPDYSGDGGQATAAYLQGPETVTLGPDGALYISDSLNYCVRRVGLDGVITTITGRGEGDPAQGAGDGGPAVLAALMYPMGLAFDAVGNLYIADWGVDRVRMIEASGVADGSGIISTVVGTGVAGFSGDGGPATEATLYAPAGLAVGLDGSLYIVDSENYVVRGVDTSGIITTVAGVGEQSGYSGDEGPATAALLDGPNDVAVDAYGNFYIADCYNNCIRKVDGDGYIWTVAGNWWADWGDADRAVDGYMDGPMGVTIAPDQKMYIADTSNSVIRLVTVPLNQLPTCDISLSPPTAAWGETISFDSQATDPDGTVASVAWDFGDGYTASGQTTSHAYDLPDTYAVTAIVTDNQGAMVRCDASVTITPQLETICREAFTADDLGWHLIALPLPPDDPDPYTGVFASSGYDPTGRLYRYDPETKSYIGLFEGDPLGFGDMDIHHGYWLSVEEPFTLCYTGLRSPPGSVSHSLAIGAWDWNWVLIGSGMESSVSLVTNAFVSRGGDPAIPFWDDDPGISDAVQELWIVLPLYGWSPAGYHRVCPDSGMGCDFDSLDPWQGYWVDVEQADLELILTP